MTLSPDGTDSMLQPAEIACIEDLLIEFHDIFARHRHERGLQGRINAERRFPNL